MGITGKRAERRRIERARVFVNVEAPHWSARGKRDAARGRAQRGMKWTPGMYREVARRNAEVDIKAAKQWLKDYPGDGR